MSSSSSSIERSELSGPRLGTGAVTTFGCVVGCADLEVAIGIGAGETTRTIPLRTTVGLLVTGLAAPGAETSGSEWVRLELVCLDVVWLATVAEGASSSSGRSYGVARSCWDEACPPRPRLLLPLLLGGIADGSRLGYGQVEISPDLAEEKERRKDGTYGSV
jgi:hypothetical protein